MASDVIRPGIRVYFSEHCPVWTVFEVPGKRGVVKGANDVLDDTVDHYPNIEGKYVYVFESDGADFGIDESTPGWDTRSSSLWANQHMAKPISGATNPKPSGAPSPERVIREIFIEKRHRYWELDIRSTWNKPRHERPHPKWRHLAKAGIKVREPETEREARAFDLKLYDADVKPREFTTLPLKRDDTPLRYYFLLSPFRLGPAALQAALDDGGVDGLSMWYSASALENDKKFVAPTQEDIRQWGYGAVRLVDPYNSAQRILTSMLEPTLRDYLKFADDMDNRVLEGVDAKHFDDDENEGTIEDLVFIGSVLTSIAASSSDVRSALDMDQVRQVVDHYALRLRLMTNSTELASRFLANWMTGTAHRLLDTSLVHDMESKDDPRAGQDKGGGLCHWHCQTRLLSNTMNGVAFLRQVLSDSKDDKDVNPIRDILWKRYENAGAPIDFDSSDGEVVVLAGDAIPDLALLGIYRLDDSYYSEGTLDSGKAEDKAEAIATLINNLTYFDAPLGNVKKAQKVELAKPIKKDWSTAKKWIKGGIYLIGDLPLKTEFVHTRYMQIKLGTKGIPPHHFGFGQLTRMDQYDTMGKVLKQATVTAKVELDAATKAADKAQDAAQVTAHFLKKVSPPPGVVGDQHIDALKQSRTAINGEIDEITKSVRSERITVQNLEGAKKLKPRDLRRLEGARTQVKLADSRVADLRRQVQSIDDEIGRAVGTAEKAHAEALTTWKKAAAKWDDLAKQYHLEARHQEAFDDIRSKVDDAAKNYKRPVTAAKVFVAVASMAVETMFFYSTMDDVNSTTRDKAWASLDFTKALLDCTKEVLKAQGIKEARWRIIVKDWKPSVAGATGSHTITGGVVSFCAVIGGAYNLGKYSIKGLDALKANDYSVVVGAGIAVIGSAITVAAGLIAIPEPISTVAGLLVVTGGLIVAYTVDSEWETYGEHCYFGSGSDAGWRPVDPTTGPGMGESHWYGSVIDPDDREKGEYTSVPVLGTILEIAGQDHCKWGVRNQRWAMERLLSRFEISSRASARSRTRDDHTADLTWSGTVLVELPHIPGGSSLTYSVEVRPNSGSKITVLKDSLDAEAMNSGVHKKKNAAVCYDASSNGPGSICLVLDDHSVHYQHRAEVVVQVDLKLQDGSVVSCTHEIADASVHSTESDEGDTYSFSYATGSVTPSTAKAFENVKDHPWPGATREAAAVQ